MDVLKNYRLVDLTHPLHEGAPTWTGRCGFRMEIRIDYDQGLRVQSYKSHAGIGTHIDAPSHFIPGGANVDQLHLEECFVPACVFDLRSRMDPRLSVSPSDVEAYEKTYGPIPQGALVIARTGWEQFWSDPEAYRNPDASGVIRFPTFSQQAAEMLLEKKIAGIGIDTLSPDGPEAFPVHLAVLGAGKYILENLAYLDRLPPKGAFAICLPLKIKGATEAGVRAAALVPKQPIV